MAAVACNNINLSFGTVQALRDVSCELGEGQVMLVLGPSGAGKTTLMRVIAGLDKPDSGVVCIHDQVMTDSRLLVPPHQRRLGFVFQRPTLWPHMTVLDNITLALSGKKMGRAERRTVAREALAELDMAGKEKRYPNALSGGELQRVALARALVTKPRILLLDEPFASLDAGLRVDLLKTLEVLKARHAVSMIWASHRFEEVYALADSVLLLRKGAVAKSGTLKQVLKSPGGNFAAEFLLA